jgi:predicted O-methyltransferase YrrM
MSTILPRLFGIFRSAGFEPLTGYSPFHFQNWRDAPFTRFVKNGQLSGIPGIALQEVMFLEGFRHFVTPRRILVIGNASGWSTVAMALIFPDAMTVAIDIDDDGVRRTNELIAANRLPARAVTARSPDDVAAVVKEHLQGSIDFSLIDAVHNNDAVIADFAAVTAVAAEGALYLLHDVINWHMIDGFNHALATHRLSGKVFTRTPSGMALAYSRISPEFESYLDCFTEPPEMFRKLRQLCLSTFVDPIAAFQNGYRA